MPCPNTPSFNVIKLQVAVKVIDKTQMNQNSIQKVSTVPHERTAKNKNTF